jgi:hypothetical protein
MTSRLGQTYLNSGVARLAYRPRMPLAMMSRPAVSMILKPVRRTRRPAAALTTMNGTNMASNRTPVWSGVSSWTCCRYRVVSNAVPVNPNIAVVATARTALKEPERKSCRSIIGSWCRASYAMNATMETANPAYMSRRRPEAYPCDLPSMTA